MTKNNLKVVKPDNKKQQEHITGHKIEWELLDNIHDVISNIDVIYMTRLQKERIKIENNEVLNNEVLNNEELNIEELYNKYKLNSDIMAKAKKNMIVLHISKTARPSRVFGKIVRPMRAKKY